MNRIAIWSPLLGVNELGFHAFDAFTGELLWDFNTSREFVTVNGTRTSGATIGGLGPVVVKSHIFLDSGYQYAAKKDKTENVLLAFLVDGK